MADISKLKMPDGTIYNIKPAIMDTELNSTSVNPVQNKAIYEKFSDVDFSIDTIHEILNTELYGFRIDKQDSNPATRVTYLYDAIGKTPAHMNYTDGTFDYGDWVDAWFIRENKPCALRYNGTVAYYLNPNNYTLKEDGTASDVSNSNFEGNFMAQLPTIWVKRWEDENYTYTAISNKQINSGFKAYAHDAGDGYVNDFIYLPMFKGAIIDSKLRSISGVKPSGNTTASSEKTAVEACGSGWQMWDWAKHELIADLLTLISRSTDSQAVFGQGDSNTYDGTDTTNRGKMTTGTSGSGQFWGTDDETHHVKVFHVEDFWGNRWDRCFGLNLMNGKYVYKLVRPYALIPDSSYVSTEISAPAAGWQKEQYVGEFGTFAKTTDGSQSTYSCDYFWASGSEKLALFGGACSGGTRCGSHCFNLNDVASSSNWGVGGSPCYNALHSGYDDKVDESVFDYVQPQIDTIREILNTELYGFRIDKQDSNPETRVTYMYDAAGKSPAHMDYTNGKFDYGDWANAWFVKDSKPCALLADGTVDYYLDPNDYTKKVDGTVSDVSDSSYAGNFMVEFPTVWIKRWEDTRYQYIAITNKQIDDDFKAYAHDAGDGYINDYIYYPMFLGYIDGTKMRSIAGVTPSSMTTTTTEKAAAEAVGTGWQMWDWSKHMLITDLLTLISRSTDSQTTFGCGVTDTQDDEDEQTYGMLATGSNDLNTGQFSGYNDMLHHVKVFHIEDYWGNRYNRCLGLNRVDGYYRCKPVRPYSITPDSSYITIGEAPSNEGIHWTKNILANEYGEFPILTDASSSTYFCDLVHNGVPSANAIALIGGNCGDQYYSGSYSLHICRPDSNALWFIGSSLCYNATHST